MRARPARGMTPATTSRYGARRRSSRCGRRPGNGRRVSDIRMATMATKVPLLDLRAQYNPLRDDVLAALTRVCDSQRFIMGPEVEGLERELAQLLDVKEAIGVSSGTDALLAAMMALGIGR